MSIFSNRIKKLRNERNTQQKEIAEAVGISLRAYQYYETETKEPTMSKLAGLADFYHVSIDYLVGRTDNPEINR